MTSHLELRLRAIDQAGALGARTDQPAVKQARKALERLRALDAADADVRHRDPAMLADQLATQLAANKVTIDEILTASAVAAGTTSDTAMSIARSAIAQAGELIADEAAEPLRKIDWRTELEPAVDKLVNRLAHLARTTKQIGYFDNASHDPAARTAYANAAKWHADWTAFLDLAATFTKYSMAPRLIEWLDFDQLPPVPPLRTEAIGWWYCEAQRNGAELGWWTRADLRSAA